MNFHVCLHDSSPQKVSTQSFKGDGVFKDLWISIIHQHHQRPPVFYPLTLSDLWASFLSRVSSLTSSIPHTGQNKPGPSSSLSGSAVSNGVDCFGLFFFFFFLPALTSGLCPSSSCVMSSAAVLDLQALDRRVEWVNWETHYWWKGFRDLREAEIPKSAR